LSAEVLKGSEERVFLVVVNGDTGSIQTRKQGVETVRLTPEPDLLGSVPFGIPCVSNLASRFEHLGERLSALLD
jgi:hypothetical protein